MANKIMSEKSVANIRAMRRKGKRLQHIADKHQCSIGTVSAILSNKKTSAYYSKTQDDLKAIGYLCYWYATHKESESETLEDYLDAVTYNEEVLLQKVLI